MSYCTPTDVAAEFKTLTFGAGLNITTASVTQFIVEASALIDSYVGSRYVTPVTGPQALAVMSLYARTLVADRVRGILANKQQTNTDANAQVKSDGFSVKDVMKALQDIKDGVSTLVGESLLLAKAGFFSNNNANDEQPVFEKNRKQW